MAKWSEELPYGAEDCGFEPLTGQTAAVKLCHPSVNGDLFLIKEFFIFCIYSINIYSFAGLIRRMPPPMFSDTAITYRHSDFTFSSSEHTGCRYPGLLDWKNLIKEG